MCGIAGFLTYAGSIEDSSLVSRMTDRMAHRGPDAGGEYKDGPVILGHRRLSIIDLTQAANQPMVDHQNRYVITFNGEIYNYQQLRLELAPYPFRTHSDTEVILAAYDRWGTECVGHFNGMFAFAIWDQQDRQLFMARDRLGKKPLYYAQTAQGLLFASELRALLASGQIERRIDVDSLAMYLKYQTVFAPRTLVNGIYQLPAGHYALVDKGSLTIQSYWTLMDTGRLDDVSDLPTVQRKVRSLLEAAVERRMVSDVPLGAFLSGGIDSSAIVALMAQQSEQPINTFTLAFAEKEFDESIYADLVAGRFNTRHTNLQVTAQYVVDELPQMLADMDTPSADGPNTYVVSKLTKQAGITVALTGLGGDELFAGYATFGRYKRLQANSWFWKLPLDLRQRLQTLIPTHLAGRQASKLSELLTLPELNLANAFLLFRQSVSTESLQALLPEQVNPDHGFDRFLGNKSKLDYLPLLSQVTLAEISYYTEPLLLRDADQMSMANSLELRVPFLDYELIQYVMQVPDSFKTRTAPKGLLVGALKPLLPKAITNRPKMGFNFPWDQWLRHELREFCQDRIQRLARRSLLNADAVLRLWQRYLLGDSAVTWNHIWLLVVLEDWLSTNDFAN